MQDLQTLELSQNSQISASTVDGKAGSVTINATDSIEINNGSLLSSSAIGNGNAGSLTITTPQFKLSDRSQVNVSSNGIGSSGSLSIFSDAVTLDNQATIYAETQSGIGGNISLQNLQTLELSQNSQISASTVDGEAGDVTVNATDSIEINNGSNLESSATGKGNAGSLTITTPQFNLSDRSQVNVSSDGIGSSGSLSIFSDAVSLDNQAKISAETQSGIGGNITLDGLNSLEVSNSEISAATETGIAGNLQINARESVELLGKGGLSVQATAGGTAGNLAVNTSQLKVTDGAAVTASSPKGQAGNLTIAADKLYLNQGRLTAETGVSEGSEGANITLTIKDLLLMRNNSLISVEAFDTTTDVGNITINNSNGFIVGWKNSDIVTNANKGNGGNINITTQGIFGLEFRPQRTPSNDIVAFGSLTINQLSIDPSSGLVELPQNLTDSSQQIVAGCAATPDTNFIVRGRSGLPSSPSDLFAGKQALVNLFSPVTDSTNIQQVQNPRGKDENRTPQLVEAQGWVVNTKGQVELVAEVRSATPQNSGMSQANCQTAIGT